MTDKEIVDQLIVIHKAMSSGSALLSNQGQALDGYSALANFIHLAETAEAEREGV
jgi:hypothetical protein